MTDSWQRYWLKNCFVLICTTVSGCLLLSPGVYLRPGVSGLGSSAARTSERHPSAGAKFPCNSQPRHGEAPVRPFPRKKWRRWCAGRETFHELGNLMERSVILRELVMYVPLSAFKDADFDNGARSGVLVCFPVSANGLCARYAKPKVVSRSKRSSNAREHEAYHAEIKKKPSHRVPRVCPID